VQVVVGEILKWKAFKRFIKERDGRHLFALKATSLVPITNCGQA
jgi:hypothetical protein